MEFKIGYKFEFTAILIGTLLGFFMLEAFGYKGNYLAKFILLVFILSLIVVRYYFTQNEGYIIEGDKILLKNEEIKYIRISKIKCISQEWKTAARLSRANEVRYFIMIDGSDYRHEIDFSYRNNKGQSLMTVLENCYGIKVNKII